MQSKINEIVDLCIKKSSEEKNIFYYFKFNPTINHILIDKCDYAGNRLGFKSEKDGKNRALGFYLSDNGVSVALEYMRNE